ncbi:MAG: hypothetical protein ACYC9J_01295 [Sulfuricaulis sp.]
MTLPGKMIELIQVSVADPVVVVNAIKDECIVYKKKYVIGRDFNLTGGKIVFIKEWHALSEGAGDPIVGPRLEKIELGLDTKGNGKSQDKGYIAGLVFMLVPFADYNVDNTRFVRIDSNRVYSDCGKH